MTQVLSSEVGGQVKVISPPGEVYKALSEAAGRIAAIAKDQENREQGFSFRSIDSIVGHAKPILKDLGLSIVPVSSHATHNEVTSRGGSKGWRCVIHMEWQISHADGSHVFASMTGEAIDYGDKATSKAAQMAYKYMLTQLLGVGSEDPDAESHDLAATPAQAEPEELSVEERRKRATNKLKTLLLEVSEGDKDLAGRRWQGIVDSFELGEVVPLGKVDDVEAAIRALAIGTGEKEEDK